MELLWSIDLSWEGRHLWKVWLPQTTNLAKKIPTLWTSRVGFEVFILGDKRQYQFAPQQKSSGSQQDMLHQEADPGMIL